MKNVFEETYTQMTALRAQWGQVKSASQRIRVKEELTRVYGVIVGMGTAAINLYRVYEVSRQNGNPVINLGENFWADEIPDLLACMHKVGITEFTFSSTWSDAVNTAWLFQQHGCSLQGMVEVSCSPLESKKPDLRPAYLFKIN